MDFEPEDLDWAMGELGQLFTRANRCGIYPHELEPDLFVKAWHVVMWQPTGVALKCRATLMAMKSGKWEHVSFGKSKKRYAVALPD